MDMGELIKKYRIQGGMTQEELGKRLNPVVQKSAVAKWENGRVDNIKREHIKQMSSMFGISPVDLMCFEDRQPEYILSSDGKQFVAEFNKLDAEDRAKILERIAVFLEADKYTKKGNEAVG